MQSHVGGKHRYGTVLKNRTYTRQDTNKLHHKFIKCNVFTRFKKNFFPIERFDEILSKRKLTFVLCLNNFYFEVLQQYTHVKKIIIRIVQSVP